DPHESPDLEPDEPLVDGSPVWEAEGSIRLDQLDRIGFGAPEGPYETLAGLLANQLARIPVRTDRVEVDGWQFDVLDIEHHRADRVRISAPAPAPALVEEDAR
ncbi:transporter associated domain-containing protein, partial [Streptomyces anulatus]|uniref:transporter associated domain-containing protein n=1 Tax=Streptomyces anulatus TaxID=1892 RepID=UPI00365E3269